MAVGHFAGATGLSTNAIAIGAFAGASGLSARSIAIGFGAGSTGMNEDSIAIGTRAGQTGPRTSTLGYTAHTFIGYQSNGTSMPGYNGATSFTVVLGNNLSDVCIGRNAFAASFNIASDYRIKTNVENLGHSYSLENLRPVSYFNTHKQINDFGFIAHELQAVIPDLVTGHKDSDDMQTVNQLGLIPFLVKELQEHKKRISKNETEIKELLQENTQFKQMIKKMGHCLLDFNNSN